MAHDAANERQPKALIKSFGMTVREFMQRRKFGRVINGLKGGINLQQALYLRSLIGSCCFGSRIEVGSYRGKSAIALCDGLSGSGVSGKPILYCVEPHREFTGLYGGQFGPEDRGAFYRAMLKTRAYRQVALINLSSEIVAPGWREPIGFLFIDGDHTYEGVKRDFESWKDHLLAGALIAFDDSTDPKGGPHRLLEELLAGPEYELVSRCGKITTLRRCFWKGVPPALLREQSLRILIFCYRMELTGGLLRFEKVGRELQALGHEVCFCTLSDELPEAWTGKVPIRRFSEVWYETWDVTMCPGAGFVGTIPPEVLACLRDARFGLRMQHVLNDRSKRDKFRQANEHFAPHVVVFNNSDWQPGNFNDFRGNSFHHLFGACDSTVFTPSPTSATSSSRWVIGGQSRKNAAVLVAALRTLPERFSLELFGPRDAVPQGNEDLLASGRLKLRGELSSDELVAYYHGLNCFVSPELQAGWSNATAEAMACGVPVICSPHGTSAFAQDQVNAFVLKSITPEEIASKVVEMESSPDIRNRFTAAARERISRFSWDIYAQELLSLCSKGRESQYYHVPDLGLYGKWPTESRLQGLAPVVARAAGCTVLDLGAAEGWISLSMLRAGVKLVHGFELDDSRVRAANAMCRDYPNTSFWQADLSDWDGFSTKYSDTLLPAYDIVLYLGIHHHLPPVSRQLALAGAAGKATSFLAIRTSRKLFEKDGITQQLNAAGFQMIEYSPDESATLLGATWLFERNSQKRRLPQDCA